jgi:putative redox protein
MAQTLEVRVEQDGASAAVGIVRTHRVAIDRPIAKGGTDKGPLGGEYLLVSLGGCFMSNLLAAIRARETPLGNVGNVRITVTATIEGTPDRVTAMAMTVGAEGADREMLEKLVEIAGRACIVTNTLKRALPITVTCDV